MKKSIQSTIFAVALLTVLVSGCAPEPVPPTPTPLPTITPIPTNTLIPTETSIPTETPIPPTATVAAPDKTLEFLNGVQVGRIDTFDNRLKDAWGFGSAGEIKDGVMEIIGQNWNGLTRDNMAFKENQGIIIDFTYTEDSMFEIYFNVGSWNTDPYKRLGIYMIKNRARINVWSGKSTLSGADLSGNLTLEPGKTYSLLMAVLPNGEFLDAIWNPSNPSEAIFYRASMGESWANLTWKLAIGANRGTIAFDDYKEIVFDGVK